MTNKRLHTDPQPLIQYPSSLRFLDGSQIEMIDEALSALGDFGEIHLIVQKGRLRFVITQNSIDARKWHPGLLDGDNS